MLKIGIFIVCLLGVLILLGRPVDAATATILNLTEEQAAKLELDGAKMKAAPSNMAGDVGEWADIGQKYGVALAATAKELGVAADELLDTTVGKVALVLIVWKVMGSNLLGVLIGVPYMIIGFGFWFYAFRRASLIHSVTVEPVEGQFWRKKTVEYYEGDSDHAWYIRWAYFGVLVVAVGLPSLIMIFSG